MFKNYASVGQIGNKLSPSNRVPPARPAPGRRADFELIHCGTPVLGACVQTRFDSDPGVWMPVSSVISSGLSPLGIYALGAQDAGLARWETLASYVYSGPQTGA